jgi:hypothetical protein
VSGPLERITVHAGRLDELSQAEELAARLLRLLRAGVPVEVNLSATAMAPGFAERMVRLMNADPKGWKDHTTVSFHGHPEVLAVLKRAMGISPVQQPKGGK